MRFDLHPLRLLEPVGRRIRLTEQARILVAHTEDVLHQLDLAEADVTRSLTELTGSVRVAVFQTAAPAWLPGVLDRLRAEHPALRVLVPVEEPDVALPALPTRDHDLVIVIAEEYPVRRCPGPRASGPPGCAPTRCGWPSRRGPRPVGCGRWPTCRGRWSCPAHRGGTG